MPLSKTRREYDLLDTHDIEEGETGRKKYSTTLAFKVSIIANIILVVLLVLKESLTGWNGSDCYQSSKPEINSMMKELSSYSPIFDIVDLSPTLKTFNGAFRDNTSIWRQGPSQEVDAAWDHISLEGFELIKVSAEDVVKSGKDAASSIQVPQKWKTKGSKAGEYLAQIEVFHQIHCLDELRREVFSDHYYPNTPRDEMRLSHVTHCIHMILQSLQCSSDVEIITHNWVFNERYEKEPKTRLFPDFNMVKKCRNFDALRDWAEKNAIKDVQKNAKDLKFEEGMKFKIGSGYGPPP